MGKASVEFNVKPDTKSTTVSIIWQTVCRRVGLLFLVIAASVSLVALTSVAPLVYQSLIDDCIPKKSAGLLLEYAGILVLLPVLSVCVGYGKDWLVYRFANVISEELRRRAYRACLYMEYRELEQIWLPTVPQGNYQTSGADMRGFPMWGGHIGH